MPLDAPARLTLATSVVFMTGVIAEAISYVWEQFGTGASIALCGLIGGLLVWLFKYNQPVRTWASLSCT